MQKGYNPKTKPSVNNFEINSLYDVHEKKNWFGYRLR